MDVKINKSLLTDLLTFRYLFWRNTLSVASVIEWINKPTSFTAAVALSSLHSIGEQSSAPQFSHTQLWRSKTSTVSNSIHLDYVCSSISRLPLTLSPRNLSYLPTFQQCVLRERMSARLIVNLAAIQMQSALRSIVKRGKIVAGGLYPHKPTLKQSPSVLY